MKTRVDHAANGFIVLAKYLLITYLLSVGFLLRSSFYLGVEAVLLVSLIVLFFVSKKIKSSLIKTIYSDTASVTELINSFRRFPFYKVVRNNKWEIIICIVYVLIMFSVIRWGLPNSSHPFPYYMDESHQLMAVKTVVKEGTSNFPHQENGPMFNYVISGLLVSPIFLLQVVDPFSIDSAISSLDAQAKVYMAFRFVSILFGIGTIVSLILISKQLKIKPLITIMLFIFTPVWLSVSNYFKYDIAFIFWTVFSLHLLLRYAETKSRISYLLAGIACALALSTKITALPLFALYIFSFFLFTERSFYKFKTLFMGVATYLFVFLFFGIPDIIFGGRSMSEYLYYNIVLNPINDKNIILGQDRAVFLLANNLPVIYGHLLFYIFIVSFIVLIIKLVLKIKNKTINTEKETILILVGFLLFSVSFIPLWIIAANRGLILLPFMAIVISIVFNDFISKNWLKVFATILIVVVIISQVFESYAWVSLKYEKNAQLTSSNWIESNIKEGTEIGIENIPIYQLLPDVIVREFYENVYGIKKEYKYKYEVIDVNSKVLPEVIILSNSEFDSKYRIKSSKKDLVKRIKNEGYKEIEVFHPGSSIYKKYANDITFSTVGLIAYPHTISVFEKME